MTKKREARLALVIAAFSILLALAGLILSTLGQRAAIAAILRNPLPPFIQITIPLTVLAFSGIGALIIVRHPRHAVGWLYLLIGAFITMTAIDLGYLVFGLYAVPHWALPGTQLAHWLEAWIWIPGIVLAFFVYLFYPDGRLPSRRWRPVVWISLLATLAAVLAFAFQPGPMQGSIFPGDNPFGIPGSGPVLGGLIVVSGLILIAMIAAAPVALLVRFQRAAGVEKKQIALLLYAAGLAVSIMFIGNGAAYLLFEPAQAILFSITSISTAVLVIPIAAGVAITRYRLWDIDRLINRTLVYGALTMSLVGVYLVSVVVFQRLIPGESQLAIVLSTLTIAFLFNPLRLRIQVAIDRRFYRQRYDTARILADFSVNVRDEVNLYQIKRELEAVIGSSVHPEHLSIWMNEP